VNAPRITDQITDQLFKANLTFCVVCVFTVQISGYRLTSGAFTIDSSTPTFR
jgi:hypothetical protein